MSRSAAEDRLRVRRGRSPFRWLALLSTAAIAGSMVLMPPVGAANEVHLVAAGDFGARAATNTVLTALGQMDPDAAIALGDLAYRDATPESAWCSYVKQRVGEGFPFELISGNHESLDVADGAINNYSACLPNQVPGIVGTYGREYYMDLPKGDPLVRVVLASPGLTFEDGLWAYEKGDPHYDWVSDAIDDGRAKGAEWIVVAAHIPCVSVGTYNCPSKRDFYDLMLAKKVDLVLAGHEHAYMRTHQLRAGVSGCTTLAVGTSDPDCISDSDDTYRAGAGTVFATVGTGGTPLRDVNPADTEAGYFAAISGANLVPTYGFLDIHVADAQLRAEFVPTSGTMTDSFTIEVGPPPANQAPTAAFTATPSGLTVAFDGSASADPDGSIASWAWDFGDGATSTTATSTSHTYAAAGTYTVGLIVTDNEGEPGTLTREVTVSDPPASDTLATDSFERSVASGWGTADVGGPWTNRGASNLSVAGGAGRISNAPGSTRGAFLSEVSSIGTDLRYTVMSDKLAKLYVSGIARSVPGAGDYRAKAVLRTDGRVELYLVRTSATGAESTVASSGILPGVTHSPGTALSMRLQASGTGPTTIRAKVWPATAAEPSAWNLTTTDSTAALQAPGGVGVLSYLSSSANNAPVVLSVDDLVAVEP